MRQVSSSVKEQFQCIIQHGRVAASFLYHGDNLSNISTEERAFKLRLPCSKEIAVPSKGIYLSVVAEVSEWLGELPGRKSVGTVTLMDD